MTPTLRVTASMGLGTPRCFWSAHSRQSIAGAVVLQVDMAGFRLSAQIGRIGDHPNGGLPSVCQHPNNSKNPSKKLNLQVVASLANELSNIKKVAAMDSDVLCSYVAKLARGIEKITGYDREGEVCRLCPIDFFMSTVDPLKESPIITANTVLSILAVDYPVLQYVVLLLEMVTGQLGANGELVRWAQDPSFVASVHRMVDVDLVGDDDARELRDLGLQ